MPQLLRRFLVLCALLAFGSACPWSPCRAWETVPAVDLATIDPTLLTDAEVDRITLNNAYSFQYYLGHFAELANSVIETGPERGYISLPIWRNPSESFNARVMENHTALAYFYSTNRPWNPYYNSPAVRERLEASLEFLIDSQSSAGWFAEYSPGGYNVPATAFATRYLGETLRLLESGPGIDPTIMQATRDADRAAIMGMLTSNSAYNVGRTASNQYGGVFGGALEYLDLYPDEEIATLLQQRMTTADADFQSPAGYYYERGGADWGYNLRTHEGNTRIAYHHARGTAIGDLIVEGEERFFDWISYNAVPIPGQPEYLLNRAIETRRQFPTMELLDYSPGEEVELARAFSISVEEQQARIAAIRADNAVNWTSIEPLLAGTATYSPSAFVYLNNYQWHPTDAQKQAAIDSLPYMASDRFVHQRADGGANASEGTYVRRDDYYAAFNAGNVLASQQRFGLGLLWNPEVGAFIQSQTGSQSFAWGTRSNGASNVYEASALNPQYLLDGQAFNAVAGATDLPDGTLSASYLLSGNGNKMVSFGDEAIHVEVIHSGSFTEQIPLLLLESDTLFVSNEVVRIVRGEVTMEIQMTGASSVELLNSSTEFSGYQLAGIAIESSGSLDYLLTFPETLLNGLMGDVNQDGLITAGDVDAFLDGWNTVLPSDTDLVAWSKGDLNLDRQHDLDDALLLYFALQQAGLPANFFGQLNPVPEPSSVVILATACLAAGVLSRRSHKLH